MDIIAGLGDRLVPFEVEYQGTEISAKKLKGLRIFLEQRKLERGYVITQRWEDFGIMAVTSGLQGKEREKLSANVLEIPAARMLLAVDLRRAQSPVIGWDSRSHQSKRSRKNANVPCQLIVRKNCPRMEGGRVACRRTAEALATHASILAMIILRK